MSVSSAQRQLWILGLFPLSEHIAWSSSFPYIYAMVTHFTSGSDRADSAALYTSLLVSCFTFGEFLTAPLWARVSDRIGRKPTLLLGSFGAMCSAAAFGFSTSLYMAFAARLLAGAANPNIGVLKTYVGELVSKEKQATGFSSLAFMAGLGFICGPVVGGYLAEPVRTMPSLFSRGSVWDHYPYLLPNLVVITCLAVSSTLGFMLLKEVHPDFQDREDLGHRVLAYFSGRFKGSTNVMHGPRYTAIGAEELDLPERTQAAEGSPPMRPSFVFRKAFTTQIILQIVTSTVQSFKDIATLSLVPVFLSSPQPSRNDAGRRSLGGGFGLSTEHTSTVLLTQAIASILCQVFLIPRVIERSGTLTSYRFALVGFILTFILMPISLLVQGIGGLFTCTLLLWIQALWFGIAGTATAMMITNNCPSPIYLATINGVAASCGCLAKTAGPALIGILYDTGVKNGNVLAPFWVLSVVAMLSLGLTTFLRDQLPL